LKNKVVVPAFLLYLLGIVLLGASVSILIKANFGISVISSLPYTLYEITKVLSIGMFVTIIQFVFLMTEIIVLKKATISMALTFVSAYLLGLFIDIGNLILASVVVDSIIIKIIMALSGIGVLAIGATLLLFSQYPPIPDLIFTRDIADAKGWNVGKVKQFVDLGFFITSLSLSLIFLGGLNGIGITTALCVLFVGKMIFVLRKFFTRTMEPHYFMGEQRVVGFLEYNILGRLNKNEI